MNALYNYIVKIEKQNFAPAGVQKNVRFFRGTSLKLVFLSIESGPSSN